MNKDNFPIEYEIKPPGKFSLGLKELWENRELFYFFAWRDIKIKYKQTVLGFLWVILQPLFLTLIFNFGIGNYFGNSIQSGLAYPVYVLSGLIIWSVFSSSVTSSGSSMVSHANIIKKIYFPRLVIPASSVIVSLFDFVVSFVLLVIFAFYYHTRFEIVSLLFILGGVFCALIASLGVGIFLSALNVKYRDFRYVTPFLLQAMFFISPIIYPLEFEHNKFLKLVLLANPMTSAIELFRAAFHTSGVDFDSIIYSIVISVVIFCFAIYYFRKTEAYFADVA